jgi:hypothetical protein
VRKYSPWRPRFRGPLRPRHRGGRGRGPARQRGEGEVGPRSWLQAGEVIFIVPDPSLLDVPAQCCGVCLPTLTERGSASCSDLYPRQACPAFASASPKTNLAFASTRMVRFRIPIPRCPSDMDCRHPRPHFQRRRPFSPRLLETWNAKASLLAVSQAEIGGPRPSTTWESRLVYLCLQCALRYLGLEDMPNSQQRGALEPWSIKR